MKKHLTTLLAACCMLAAFSMPASALEYTIDAPDAGLFGRVPPQMIPSMSPRTNPPTPTAAKMPPTFRPPLEVRPAIR